MTLTVSNLTGGYSQVPVLKDLNFELATGEIVGLIGLNGAGKSTTIKHIIGLLTPQKGTITLNDLTLATNPEAYKKAIAFVPETPVLYQELTLKEHIELTIMAYDLEQTAAWERANTLLTTFRLDNKLDWFPANFSKGMKQKVMIVTAFMTQADLYIIDEPFLGLDPLAIHDLLMLMVAEKKRGATILMSTHILATAEQYADRFILLNNGNIRAQGSIADLKAAFSMEDATLDEIYLAMSKEG